MSAGAASGSSGAGVDVWTLLQDQRKAKAKGSEETKADGTPSSGDAAPEEGSESFVLFAGSKQAGKTSLVTQFLNPAKDDSPKPTVALEYTFGRRSNTTTTVKDIAHIWELGGGSKLSDLINVPITPTRLSNAVVVLVLDLSQPGTVINDLMTWLALVKGRITECCDKLKKTKPALLASMLEAAAERVQHSSHPDNAIITPMAVPLVIVASKYDVFEDFESVQRKPLLQTLRYVALCHGASLVCVGHREKIQTSHFRSLLNHYVFHTELKRAVQNNPAKALVIPAGADTLELIGLPPGSSVGDVQVGSLQSRVERYRRGVDEMFAPSAPAEERKERDEDTAEFVEGAIDAMRAQKLDEIEQYKKDAERKLRNAAKASSRKKK